MKRIMYVVLAALLPLGAGAETVEIGGVYYNLVSKIHEAEVASSPNRYSGDIVILDSLEYDGVMYHVTGIEGNAFQNSGITAITIPNSILSIDIGAFEGCSELTSVHIASMESWCKIDFRAENSYYNTNNTSNPLRLAHHLYLNGEEVRELIVPTSITKIKPFTFTGSSIISIVMHNKLTSIENSAFSECKNLTAVSLPNTVRSIGHHAFDGCSSLTSVEVPNSVGFIGAYAFSGCRSLTTFVIPSGIASIPESVFSGCSSLVSVTIPDDVVSIDHYSFSGCTSLASITIPDKLTSIGNSAFSGCRSLTSVSVPDSVTTIGTEAFLDCKGLKQVVLGESVNNIGSKAFSSCQDLMDLYCYAENVPSTAYNTFEGSYIDYATLHVPSISVNTYKSNYPWTNFKAIVSIDGALPDNKKCGKPTIAYANGELVFGCETKDVEYVSTIRQDAPEKMYDERFRLFPFSIIITVQAVKSGYEDSDVATATISWREGQPLFSGFSSVTTMEDILFGDVNCDHAINVADIASIISIMAKGSTNDSINSSYKSALVSHYLCGYDWTGNIEGYYYSRWNISGDNLSSVFRFTADSYFCTSGRGMELDYNTQSPNNDYAFCTFRWFIVDNVITLIYDDSKWQPIYFKNFDINSSIFTGKISNGGAREIEFELSPTIFDFSNWSNRAIGGHGDFSGMNYFY